MAYEFDLLRELQREFAGQDDREISMLILLKIHHIFEELNQIKMTLSDIQQKVNTLIQDVTDEDTVIDSAVTLITGLVQTLADLKAQLAAAGTDATALASVGDSLDGLISTVSSKKDALAASVAAGTPA